ncbi:LamG domain-containing protein, partial [Inquilinus limosus]|uniref:hypothetical protein n=1 Tax=Inquilinus limosus TaxID=171674 RepID=UPI001872A2DD
MYEIDPSRLDLAREFRSRPFGLHSPELQAVLIRMRSLPVEGKHCLIVLEPRARWLLARMEGQPLRPVPVPGIVFTDLAEAEWTVFKLRWHALTGHDLAAALGEPALPPPVSPPPAAPDPDRAILAYADAVTAALGDVVNIQVSCLGIDSFRADIVRLLSPQTGPDGQGYREEEVPTEASGTYPGRVQPIRLGSHIELPVLADPPASFTLHVLAWPTRPASGAQALAGTWSEATRRGFALCLDDRGALALRLGNGAETAEYSTGVPLAERRWYRLAATFDADSGTIELHQIPIDAHGLHPAAPVTTRHRARFAPAASAAP